MKTDIELREKPEVQAVAEILNSVLVFFVRLPPPVCEKGQWIINSHLLLVNCRVESIANFLTEFTFHPYTAHAISDSEYKLHAILMTRGMLMMMRTRLSFFFSSYFYLSSFPLKLMSKIKFLFQVLRDSFHEMLLVRDLI